MELKKGMYIRIKDKNNNQFIRKIIELPEDIRYGSIVVDKDIHYARWVSKKNIVKASANIIDLIEEGDYVNGSKVEKITTFNGMNFVDTYMTQGYGWGTCIPENEIRTVVTREQFENMMYIVESED